MHVYDPAADAWRLLQPSPGLLPSPRSGHGLVADGSGALFIFGGSTFPPDYVVGVDETGSLARPALHTVVGLSPSRSAGLFRWVDEAGSVPGPAFHSPNRLVQSPNPLVQSPDSRTRLLRPVQSPDPLVVSARQIVEAESEG